MTSSNNWENTQVSKHSFSICVQDECEFDFTLPWQVAAIYAAPVQRKPIGW
jgi:hypothetical protein